MDEVGDSEKTSSELFWPFIYSLYKNKLEASGFPHNVKSDADKVSYVEKIYKKEGIQLKMSNIKFYPGRRQMAKVWLNSFW